MRDRHQPRAGGQQHPPQRRHRAQGRLQIHARNSGVLRHTQDVPRPPLRPRCQLQHDGWRREGLREQVRHRLRHDRSRQRDLHARRHPGVQDRRHRQRDGRPVHQLAQHRRATPRHAGTCLRQGPAWHLGHRHLEPRTATRRLYLRQDRQVNRRHPHQADHLHPAQRQDEADRRICHRRPRDDPRDCIRGRPLDSTPFDQGHLPPQRERTRARLHPLPGPYRERVPSEPLGRHRRDPHEPHWRRGRQDR
ncbi:unannotated protein [freshwater metagenome]|uniref:Unannotated protein n=1 Tax=freshwater metagenome TaxID=449393 RepID=A0A6J7C928_9ZZZZ